MKEVGLKRDIKYLWGLSLKETIAVTFCGALIAISKLIIKIPLNIPGHSGAIWMAILMFCCLRYNKGMSGILAGTIAGLLAVMFGLGKEGPFVFFKYFLPGVTVDLIFCFVSHKSRKLLLVGVVAAFAHWTKLLVNYILGIIFDLPRGFLLLGIKIATVNHLVFGFIGGVIAYFIYERIKLHDRTNSQ